MFYHHKEKSGFFIWNDHTKGQYGPFESIFSKNVFLGEREFPLELSDFPGYKYALGLTKNKIFILDEKGNIDIQTIS